ncbi:hypothetical protein [Roseomonas chloroacetimidivorans]|uniref:hypothetical protein n=1 Tax=Roseomonas chloroacetimidivorans TaxID=1766656 RepID=UPI003C725632
MAEADILEAPAESWDGEGREPHSLASEATPHLSVEGFEGPLDFLLEMVRRQRVDLGPLSILALTDQLVGAIENSGGGIRLERRAELYVSFLEATLVLLEGREGQGAEPPASYRPAPLDLWRIPDALKRITELLRQTPAGVPIERCLPPLLDHTPDRPIRLRAALASTLVAGLELVRDGSVRVNQDDAFGPIFLELALTGCGNSILARLLRKFITLRTIRAQQCCAHHGLSNSDCSCGWAGAANFRSLLTSTRGDEIDRWMPVPPSKGSAARSASGNPACPTFLTPAGLPPDVDRDKPCGSYGRNWVMAM